MSKAVVVCALFIVIVKFSNAQILANLTGRRPTRADHTVCLRNHNGPGIRTNAVRNRNGDMCKTYCRVLHRSNNTQNFFEYNAPNNVRCGPGLISMKCLDGKCEQSNVIASGSSPVENAFNAIHRRRNRVRPTTESTGVTQNVAASFNPTRRIFRDRMKNRRKPTHQPVTESFEGEIVSGSPTRAFGSTFPSIMREPLTEKEEDVYEIKVPVGRQ